MRIKPGAVLDGVHYALWYSAVVVDVLRQQSGLGEATITGGREDAPGRARNTLHPFGLALDFRTRDLPGGSLGQVAQDLARSVSLALQSRFDVVLESDHLHIELAGVTV